jgi:hypothetical protein
MHAVTGVEFIVLYDLVYLEFGLPRRIYILVAVLFFIVLHADLGHDVR